MVSSMIPQLRHPSCADFWMESHEYSTVEAPGELGAALT
jgi:hypothetical protein